MSKDPSGFGHIQRLRRQKEEQQLAQNRFCRRTCRSHRTSMRRAKRAKSDGSQRPPDLKRTIPRSGLIASGRPEIWKGEATAPSRIIADAISGMTTDTLHPHRRPLRHDACTSRHLPMHGEVRKRRPRHSGTCGRSPHPLAVVLVASLRCVRCEEPMTASPIPAPVRF